VENKAAAKFFLISVQPVFQNPIMTRVSAKNAVNPYATTVYSDQPSVVVAGNCIYKIPQTQW
jgi:hypothetical protein